MTDFDLEGFMKSITYPPAGMTMNYARALVEAEGENFPAPIREAHIVRKALELLPIGIRDDDLLAGRYGAEFAGDDFVKKMAAADDAEFSESDEYRLPEEDRIASGRHMLFGIYTPSHTCVDYETIVNKGFEHYLERIERRIGEPVDEYGMVVLEAMKYSVESLRLFACRYADMAGQMALEEEDPQRKEALRRMARALRRSPFSPARNLYEALQGMWIVHTFTPTSERSWASVSLGRMDEYLLPLYDDWLASGHTEQEAEELFESFFHLLDSYGDGSGALNLGGDWNRLSKLLVGVEKKTRLRAPIIAARINDETPDDVFEELICRDLFQIGQPTYYGEDRCGDALRYRGMSPKDNFSVNSCMGNIVTGSELADMWGCCVNMNLPLELTVNGGLPLHGELPESVKAYLPSPQGVPKRMGDIRRGYDSYVKGLVNYVADRNIRRAAWTALNRPNPFLSVLLDDCIEFARDRAHSAVGLSGSAAMGMIPEADAERYGALSIRKGRGARYHNVTVLAMGFAHAADAITAINRLVFEEKKYSLQEITSAAKRNYSGKPGDAEIHAALRRCPKYGQGCDTADGNAAFVMDVLADACEHAYRGNIRYLPTCHTIDANVQFGSCVNASLDGRQDGEAFGKNAGAVIWALQSSPVDLMLSCAKLPQKRCSGGVPIDLYVQPDMLDTKESRMKFRDLLLTYFRMGGMQVQVNSVDSGLLKKAYANPEEYPQVIVRKGGFSIYFTDMLKSVQEDMIARFEAEAGR
ncbi:MAG: hypothetical protein LBK04_06515 [Clostridiales Family XIII bacterium]|jgi:formate C-acetyltransferase|nr:hypothetical protein [Clostridiales Family XIII bacterium]